MSDANRPMLSVFSEAVALATAGERAAYLDRACGGDAELRAQVEALVQAHDRAGEFLQGRPSPAALEVATDQPAEGCGTIIGPYKLMEQIGEGGMGLVFVAEQQRPVRRKVALKIIKPGMDTRQVIARFEAERQALALMDHPNIAKVHDAGATESGRPYFVMELVKGVPITEYCDRHKLPVRERLGLFVQVCQAVQHAHQKGIIHRDLKPSNVLVAVHDVTPVVKVIDFGIAKATGQQLTEKTVYTGIAQLVGTVQYMSPEQAGLSALDVDTRSDVYSLGVLLYELLTGTTPLEAETVRRADYDELRRIIREEEPPRPSTRISTLEMQAQSTLADRRGIEPRRLRQQLRGELDWVVMKALEKDRNRRYQSPGALAADVGHYLRDEPVEACPPSAGYRLRKLARRYKAALLTAGLVAAALLTGTAVSAWKAVEANDARRFADGQHQRAEQNLALARKVIDGMLTQVGDEELKNIPRVAHVRRDLLEKALAFSQEVLRAEGDDPAALQDVGKAYFRLAETYGDEDQGDRWASAMREAATIQERLTAAYPDRAEYQEDLARTCWRLGWVGKNTGKPEEGEKAGRRACALRAALLAREPASPRRRAELAYARDGLGVVLYDVGKIEEGQELLRQARDACQKVVEECPGVPEYRRQLAAHWIHLDPKHMDPYQGNKETVHSGRQALALLEALVAESPASYINRHDLALYEMCLANNLVATSQPEEAERLYRRALASWLKLADEFSSKDSFDFGTWCGKHLGELLAKSGRQREAEEVYGQVLASLEKGFAYHVALGPKSRNAGARAGQLLGWLSDCPFPQLRDPGRVVEVARKAIELEPDNIRHRALLAAAYVRAGDEKAAAALLEKVPESRRPGLYNNLAWRLAASSEPELRYPAKAVALARKAVELAPRDGNFRNTLGVACYRNGDWKAAVEALEKSEQLAPGKYFNINAFFLAMAHWQLGQKDVARTWYDKAVAWTDQHQPQNGELRGFRAEAAGLLGISDAAEGKKGQK